MNKVLADSFRARALARCDPATLRAGAQRCRELAVAFERAATLFEHRLPLSALPFDDGHRHYRMSSKIVVCPECGWTGHYLSKHKCKG